MLSRRRKIRRSFAGADTFLTLVIALGGIATGVGAIWAAMLAGCQAQFTERSLDEQHRFLLQNAFAEDGAGEVPPLSTNNAAMTVCNCFEEIGDLQRIGVLSDETAWNNASHWSQAFWLLCKPAVEKMRQEWENPALYAQFERLSRLMAEMDRERGIAPPTPERLRQIMAMEAATAEEPPTATR
jgi:hypothetical protein